MVPEIRQSPVRGLSWNGTPRQNQETSVLFPPEQANLGNLTYFLNIVEHYAIRNAKTIRHRTMGLSSFGEPYYLGMLR